MNLDSAVITETERIDEWATQDSTVRGDRVHKRTRDRTERKRERENSVRHPNIHSDW